MSTNLTAIVAFCVLLKKSNLPVNNLRNYRLVSNLSLIFSKIIKKVVSNRLQAHINFQQIEQSYAVCLPKIPFL